MYRTLEKEPQLPQHMEWGDKDDEDSSLGDQRRGPVAEFDSPWPPCVQGNSAWLPSGR